MPRSILTSCTHNSTIYEDHSMNEIKLLTSGMIDFHSSSLSSSSIASSPSGHSVCSLSESVPAVMDAGGVVNVSESSEPWLSISSSIAWCINAIVSGQAGVKTRGENKALSWPPKLAQDVQSTKHFPYPIHLLIDCWAFLSRGLRRSLWLWRGWRPWRRFWLWRRLWRLSAYHKAL